VNIYVAHVEMEFKISLVPRNSTPPVFDCLQYARRPESYHVIHSRLSYFITSLLNSQVMYETNLAVCASYKDGTSTSRELH